MLLIVCDEVLEGSLNTNTLDALDGVKSTFPVEIRVRTKAMKSSGKKGDVNAASLQPYLSQARPAFGLRIYGTDNSFYSDKRYGGYEQYQWQDPGRRFESVRIGQELKRSHPLGTLSTPFLAHCLSSLEKQAFAKR